MLYLVDGYAGTPHITAPQVGDYNAGITGGGSCVFNVGEKLRAEMVNANTVRIYDGCFLFQGSRRGGIQAGSYEDVSIDNGTQDQKRNDLILIKYEKDSSSQKESLSLAVLKGTPGASAQDPSYSEGDIREGDLVCYMPLYRVKLDGINMTGVEKLFTERKSTVQLEQELAGKQGTVTGGASTITGSNLTANRALVSNGSGKVAGSAVPATELGYLDGVTSGIQGQLNRKQGTVTGGASTITGSNLTANRALVSNGSGKVAVSAVTSTELGYLDGVTSGIQGQINGLSNNLKAPQYGEVSGNVAEVSAGSTTTKTICTCQKTGTVFIWARCAYPSDYGNNRQMVTVNKNGKEIAREDGILYISGISIRREVSTFVKCVPGDTITVSALNQAGSGKRLTFDWRYAVIGT